MPEPLRHIDPLRHEGAVEPPALPGLAQQAVEQRDIGVRRDGEVEVGALGGLGPARIDDDDFGPPRLARRLDPLPDHRMAPGGVRADQHDQVGLVEVAVGAGDHVLAEGAIVRGDGAGHAQPRIGVDIGRADEALHQLVGDVVVLGEQLAGDVEGDAVGPVFGDGGAETVGNFR